MATVMILYQVQQLNVMLWRIDFANGDVLQNKQTHSCVVF
jgi:hypothetical protein